MKSPRYTAVTALCICFLTSDTKVHASDQDIVGAGDALPYLLPASTCAGTIIAKDNEGAYHIGSSMALIAEGSWISTSNDEHFDAVLMFNDMFDRHWGTGFGYAEYKRRTDTSERLNSVKHNVVLLNVGYTF